VAARSRDAEGSSYSKARAKIEDIANTLEDPGVEKQLTTGKL
jgi:hypothetical protein